MTLSERYGERAPTLSARFLAKMDTWLRSLDPAAELVFREVMIRESHPDCVSRRFASRYDRLRRRQMPPAAEDEIAPQ